MKQIKIVLTIILGLFLAEFVSAQVTPEWATSYVCNYPLTITENDMVTDKNGNVYITGYTMDTASMPKNIVTLKYNSSGQFQWVQYYDSLSYYTKIATDDSGNVYIAAHCDTALVTIKYNTQGLLKWVRSYNSGTFYVWAFDIITDDAYNVYLSGYSGNNKFTTIKYNTLGIQQWIALDGPSVGLNNSYITIDKNKNVYITALGDTVGYASVCKTIKYNSAGVKQWESIYKSNFSPGLSGPRDLKYDPSGFIYLLAYTTNNNSGQGDYVVVKYDTLGNQLWALPYSFTNYYDVPKALAFDKAGNVYATGIIWQTGGTIDSIATIKINKSGVFKWKKTYSSGFWNDDEPQGIAVDSSGYIYVVGKSSDSFNAENFVTIKYDSTGNVKWIGRYKNTPFSSDEGNSISLDKFGNVYVCGSSYETNSSGILTIKYSNAVGINELSDNSSDLVNIFPNPFQTSLTIKTNNDLDNAQLLLYDEFGREVLKMDNINTSDILIQRNNLSDGIYFFRLLENNQVIAKGKIIAD